MTRWKEAMQLNGDYDQLRSRGNNRWVSSLEPRTNPRERRPPGTSRMGLVESLLIASWIPLSLAVTLACLIRAFQRGASSDAQRERLALNSDRNWLIWILYFWIDNTSNRSKENAIRNDGQVSVLDGDITAYVKPFRSFCNLI